MVNDEIQKSNADISKNNINADSNINNNAAGIANKSGTGNYDASNIVVLGGLDAVRKRPAMYIGSVSGRGLHHMVYEIVDNSIDEALAGYCSKIIVVIGKDNSITVTDNGRGIPIDLHPKYNMSALEVVMTKLHAGGKFDKNTYKVSGGLHGVGLSVVSALSKNLEITVKKGGKLYFQKYQCGAPVTKLEVIGECNPKDTGTIIHFWPDDSIFTETVFDFQILENRLRELAFLNKKIHITLRDERIDETERDTEGNVKTKEKEYYYEGGIVSFVEFLNKNKKVIHPPVYMSKAKDNVEVDVAIQYSDSYNESVYSFVNNINTIEGGSHLVGFKTALTRTLNNYIEKNPSYKEKEKLTSEDVREGLSAVISVKVPEPQFEGQTKTKLGNSEVKGIVDSVVSSTLTTYLEENPKTAALIIDKAMLASRAREAARKARELTRRKSVLEFSTLPGKLADCSESDPSKCEIFIVEGDSAGGCFSGNTKVALVDGRSISFKELVKEDRDGKENYCYTIMNDGHLGIQKIKNPRATKHDTQVIKIILDSDEDIICTPDHLFMLRDGTYKKAIELQKHDSLMPLKKQLSRKGKRITIEDYELIFDPKAYRWIFTHMLSDEYNILNGIYTAVDGAHRHHKDFNKLNNYPTNLCRLTKDEHLALHASMAQKTLRREDVLRKLQKLRQAPKFREKISKKMLSMREELSRRAKMQWENKEYKEFMVQKFLEFYRNNEAYRESNRKMLSNAQKKYWSFDDNKLKQSLRVKKFFEENPQMRQILSNISKEQWMDKKLVEWRKEKTKEQWTQEFRIKRMKAYNETYFKETMSLLRTLYEETGEINPEQFEYTRTNIGSRNILSFNTFRERFFDNDASKVEMAVENYNHKIKDIIRLDEKIDVYDIEVPETHNFALASGVFVHNSAKQGRKREFQAILPLRGKILNVEKARLSKVITSEQISNIITAIGTGISEEFNLQKLRYHKIIIMADSDVDGSHIRTLMLTFFYRYMKPLIENGHIYLAQPPLYLVKKGGQKHYCLTDKEKDELLAKIGSDVAIQRYKGLGEMNPEQLWETTMDPDLRTLKRVNIEDAVEADRIFETLMGDEVAPRREFIETHAKEVQNLDI